MRRRIVARGRSRPPDEHSKKIVFQSAVQPDLLIAIVRQFFFFSVIRLHPTVEFS